MASQPVHRSQLSCGNLAHGIAACAEDDKSVIKMMDSANVGIVTAYNDMLSAHAPYADYPQQIKAALKKPWGAPHRSRVAYRQCVTA
jgi:phosphogluconate dehydratase